MIKKKSDHSIIGSWACQEVYGAVGNILPSIKFNNDGTGTLLKTDFIWSLIANDTITYTIKLDHQTDTIKAKYHVSKVLNDENVERIFLTNTENSLIDFKLCRPNSY